MSKKGGEIQCKKIRCDENRVLIDGKVKGHEKTKEKIRQELNKLHSELVDKKYDASYIKIVENLILDVDYLVIYNNPNNEEKIVDIIINYIQKTIKQANENNINMTVSSIYTLQFMMNSFLREPLFFIDDEYLQTVIDNTNLVEQKNLYNIELESLKGKIIALNEYVEALREEYIKNPMGIDKNLLVNELRDINSQRKQYNINISNIMKNIENLDEEIYKKISSHNKGWFYSKESLPDEVTEEDIDELFL